MSNTIKCLDCFKLLSMLDNKIVKAKMNKYTYKIIVGTSGSIDPDEFEDKYIVPMIQGIKIVFEDSMKPNDVDLIGIIDNTFNIEISFTIF